MYGPRRWWGPWGSLWKQNAYKKVHTTLSCASSNSPSLSRQPTILPQNSQSYNLHLLTTTRNYLRNFFHTERDYLSCSFSWRYPNFGDPEAWRHTSDFWIDLYKIPINFLLSYISLFFLLMILFFFRTQSLFPLTAPTLFAQLTYLKIFFFVTTDLLNLSHWQLGWLQVISTLFILSLDTNNLLRNLQPFLDFNCSLSIWFIALLICEDLFKTSSIPCVWLGFHPSGSLSSPIHYLRKSTGIPTLSFALTSHIPNTVAISPSPILNLTCNLSIGLHSAPLRIRALATSSAIHQESGSRRIPTLFDFC